MDMEARVDKRRNEDRVRLRVLAVRVIAICAASFVFCAICLR